MMSSLLSDGIPVLAIVALAAVLLIALAVLSQRTLWAIFAVIATINPMPIALPVAPAQAFAIANVVSDPGKSARVIRNFIPACFFGLAIMFSIALLWSPHPSSASGTIIATFAVVAAIVFATRAEEATSQDLMRRTMNLIASIALIQSCATIFFRLNPDLELSYFRSELFYFLLGDSGIGLLTTMSNNVTDPDKAGGLLFVNGNRASMVMAVWGMIYLSLWFRRRTFMAFAVGAVCFTGSIMTGSKTAIILAVAIPILFLLLPALVRVRTHPISFLFGALATLAVVSVLYNLADSIPETLTGADASSQDRADLRSAGIKYLGESPILGLGFGGWSDRWAVDSSSYGMLPDLPPHNIIVSIWTNAGFVAIAFAALAVAGMFVGYLRMISRASTRTEAIAISLELGAAAWMIAHAMFDNTDVYGVWNTIPIFAILAARASHALSRGGRISDAKGLPDALPMVTARTRE